MTALPLIDDATPAYRGYRLQALYTLQYLLRFLSSSDVSIQPEGQEDLAVFRNGTLTEVAQVKSSPNLSLSSLAPDKSNSFFYRVAPLARNADTTVRIATFSSVGPELRGALSGDETLISSVAAKLAAYGHLSERQAEDVLRRIELEELDERQVYSDVISTLGGALTGIDPLRAFDLLTIWLYQQSERKSFVTAAIAMEHILATGRFLREVAAHHSEWFTTIEPIEDVEVSDDRLPKLSEQFYEGTAARFEHVVAGLDVLRPDKLNLISAGFDASRLVIVHGASGQGKSTLCYRYLREYVPAAVRFGIRTVTSTERALQIALAITSHARSIGVDVFVYIDVRPSDVGWAELARSLSSSAGIRVLVSVREEDWQRTSVSAAEVSFAEVSLDFDSEEAAALYERLVNIRPPKHLLSFSDAWTKFGGQGPLLEFVYLITQGGRLQDRLQAQVRRIEDEARTANISPDELNLLRMVSVASAYGARLITTDLLNSLHLPAPDRTLELFQNEYLIALSSDGAHITGLHPIRSTILADIMTGGPASSWEQTASQCLPLIQDEDIEAFLMFAFSRRPITEIFVHHVLVSSPKTWVAAAGILRALLWLGVSTYVHTNAEVIREAHSNIGDAWWMVTGADVMNAVDTTTDWLDDPDIAAETLRVLGQDLRSKLVGRGEITSLGKTWLANLADAPDAPSGHADFAALSECLFWAGRLGISWRVEQLIDIDAATSRLWSQPLDTVASFAHGLQVCGWSGFKSWRRSNREELLSIFRRRTLTVCLDNDGIKITAHFLVKQSEERDLTGGASPANASDPDAATFNGQSVATLSSLIQIEPGYSEYECFGYGHRVTPSDNSHNETHKRFTSSTLPSGYLVRLNAVARGLGDRLFRIEDWAAYAGALLLRRKEADRQIRVLLAAIDKWFRTGHKAALELVMQQSPWDAWKQAAPTNLAIPLCAVDEWGLIDEMTKNLGQKLVSGMTSNTFLALDTIRDRLKAVSEWQDSLSIFFIQAAEVVELNAAIGLVDTLKRDSLLKLFDEAGVSTNQVRLSAHNLWRVTDCLPAFQDAVRTLIGNDQQFAGMDAAERKLYADLADAWHMFAFEPHRKITHAATHMHTLRSQAFDELRKRLVQNATRSVPAVQCSFDEAPWADENSLCIRVDGENALESHLSAPLLIIEAIRAVLQPISLPNREYAGLSRWKNVIVIPLIGGRSLTGLAMQVPVVCIASEFPLSWVSFLFKPMPIGLVESLRIERWTLPALTAATELWLASCGLVVLARYRADVGSVPCIDAEGTEILSQQYERIFADIVPTSDRLVKSSNTIMNYYSGNGAIGDGRALVLERIQVIISSTQSLLDVADPMSKMPDEFIDIVQKAQLAAFEACLIFATDVYATMEAHVDGTP